MTSPAHDSDPVVELLQAVSLPLDDANLTKGEEALANSLVWFGQEYLAEHSDEWDVELFFDTYGTPRGDVRGWTQAILSGLGARPDIADIDRQQIFARARARAITKLTAR
ncbi:hypothetical protein ACWEP5_36270 [Nocardia niigatensis]